MKELVAVKSPLDLIIEVGSKRLPIENLLKREALMFDRIAVPQIGQATAAFEKLASIAELGNIAEPLYAFQAQIDYLKQHEIVFDDISSAQGEHLRLLTSIRDFRQLASIEWPIAQAIFEGLKSAGLEKVLGGEDVSVNEMLSKVEQVPRFAAPLIVALQLIVRKLSIQLRVLNKMEAYPIFSEVVPPVPLQPAERNAEVINIAINALPIPDETVSWEQVIEFRSDPDSRSKFLALRNWMNDAARGQLAIGEIEMKLEQLLDEYQRHMNLHRMKSKVGRLETITLLAANLIERRFTDAATKLFSAKQQKLSILEAELSAPGKEVAFIIAARERLGAAA